MSYFLLVLHFELLNCRTSVKNQQQGLNKENVLFVLCSADRHGKRKPKDWKRITKNSGPLSEVVNP